MEIDGAPGVAFEAGVEEVRWVVQRGALGEGHLHDRLVGLANNVPRFFGGLFIAATISFLFYICSIKKLKNFHEKYTVYPKAY